MLLLWNVPLISVSMYLTKSVSRLTRNVCWLSSLYSFTFFTASTAWTKEAYSRRCTLFYFIYLFTYFFFCPLQGNSHFWFPQTWMTFWSFSSRSGPSPTWGTLSTAITEAISFTSWGQSLSTSSLLTCVQTPWSCWRRAHLSIGSPKPGSAGLLSDFPSSSCQASVTSIIPTWDLQTTVPCLPSSDPEAHCCLSDSTSPSCPWCCHFCMGPCCFSPGSASLLPTPTAATIFTIVW